jgi:membrane protein implicated in regulation of membrane protease activity
VFLIVALVLLFVLPSPWKVVGFAVSLVLFLGELLLWYRLLARAADSVEKADRSLRRRRLEVDAETLIGQTAIVVSACRPDGRVKLLEEVWEARCADGADPGDEVVVAASERLKLVVERARSTSSPGR